jgi:quercetin dioxygenase-like cupin family protein
MADDRRDQIGAAVTAFGDVGETSPHAIWTGVVGRVIPGARVTFVVVELEPDAVVPEHAHENEQLGVLVKGAMSFRVGEERRELDVGGTWSIPPNTPHEVVAGPEGAVAVEVFAPGRGDWDTVERLEPTTPDWPG